MVGNLPKVRFVIIIVAVEAILLLAYISVPRVSRKDHKSQFLDSADLLSNNSRVLALMHVAKQERVDFAVEQWRSGYFPNFRLIFFTTTPTLVFPPEFVVYHLSPELKDIGKLIRVLKFINENYLDTFDWLLKLDDDTFMDRSELMRVLVDFDSTSSVIIGNAETWRQRETPWMSGGAGYVLSQRAFSTVVPLLHLCDDGHTWAEDQYLSDCARRADVRFSNHLGFHWAPPERFVEDGEMDLARVLTQPVSYHYMTVDRVRSIFAPARQPRILHQAWPYAEDFERSSSELATRMRKCRDRFVAEGWEHRLVTLENWYKKESCGGFCSSYRYAAVLTPAAAETLALLERLYLVGGLALSSTADCTGSTFSMLKELEYAPASKPTFGAGKAVLSPGGEDQAFLAVAATQYHHEVFRLYGLMTFLIRQTSPSYLQWELPPPKAEGMSGNLSSILNSRDFALTSIKNYDFRIGVAGLDGETD